jgi:PAS domain S-box-containing protein
MAKVVDVLPGGWQYSDLACAAIWLDRGGQYQSKDFREPVWRMTEPIMVNGAEAGRVMVGYMGDDWDGPGDQAPFLAEERALLRMIAERLGHIVSRFQTLRELKDSEERARALLNATDDVVALIEQDGSIVTVNDKFVERFGHDAQHYVGRNAFDLFPPDIAAERIQRLNQVFETGRSLSFEDQRGPHHLENALYPIFDSSGRVVMTAVYARDVTDRAKARERVQSYQDQLRSLAAQLSVAEEKERRQIAMDMHDGVGQLLAVAQIRAARLLAKTQTPAEAEELQGLVKLLEQASTETRNLTCQLHPTSLSKLGLGAALDEYLEIIGREHGLETRMHDDFKDKPLAPDAQVAAFRLTRELLINVVKHAQASTIDLYYQRVDNAVRITVSDNGVGFQPVDPPDVFLSRSFGLASVRERLTNLRGRLEVDSAPGRGSNVTLVVPLSDS